MDRIIAAQVRRDSTRPPDPLDVLFDFLIEEGGSIGTIYAHHTEEDMNLALIAALVLDRLRRLGAGDRGPAPPRASRTRGASARSPASWASTSANRQLLRLEDAVRKMTSLNAAKVGLDRPRAAPARPVRRRHGLRPDQVVIDRATYLDPFQYSEGIVHVVVNGRLVLEDGR